MASRALLSCRCGRRARWSRRRARAMPRRAPHVSTPPGATDGLVWGGGGRRFIYGGEPGGEPGAKPRGTSTVGDTRAVSSNDQPRRLAVNMVHQFTSSRRPNDPMLWRAPLCGTELRSYGGSRRSRRSSMTSTRRHTFAPSIAIKTLSSKGHARPNLGVGARRNGRGGPGTAQPSPSREGLGPAPAVISSSLECVVATWEP